MTRNMPMPQNTPPPVNDAPDFELLYLAVRALEGRIYSDKELERLPDIAPSHLHFKEWKIRRQSAEKLTDYLAKKKRPLYILEVGCGNGWLAAKLAGINGANVVAFDTNRAEVAQAARVFKKQNLQFFSGSFESGHFAGAKFDAIVFAASIQYFSPLGDIIQKMQPYLTDTGEIHIIDSKFYTAFNIADAALRTQEYYAAMRYPEMAAFYYHHRLDELAGHSHRVMSSPYSLKNRLLKNRPFYWIQIDKAKA